MRILLIGGSGQVGRALIEAAPEPVAIDAPPRAALDLARPHTITAALQARPDVVVNAAAYTAVDRAEDEPAEAYAANRDGPAHLARQCAAGRIPLIHISTDYIFDGAKPGPYLESDMPGPLNVYGRSKLQGEIAVRALHSRHVILRCSWIFGRHGTNFVRSILARAVRGETLRVVDDQRGCPTPASTLARAILTIAAQLRAGGDVEWGTYHYAGRDPATWFELATAVVALARPWLGTVPPILPVSSEQYPARARRPANSVLDCGLIAMRFGVHAEPWTEPLATAVASLRKAFQ